MRQILHFLRKDFRRCWPWVLAANGAMAIAEIHSAQLNFRDDDYVWIAVAIACGFLVASVVQAENLTHSSAYWLSRPFSRAQVFAAKALFLAFTVALPHFLFDCIGLATYGVNLLHSLPAILGAQLFFAAWFLLPAFALAAITKGIPTFTAAGLILGLVWALAFRGVDFFDVLILPSGWLGWSLRCAIVWIAAGGVAVAQYRARRANWAAAALASAIVATLPGWDLRGAEVALRPNAKSAIALTAPDPNIRFDKSGKVTVVDIEVTGIPAGMACRAGRIRLAVQSTGGDWSTGWMAPRLEIDDAVSELLGAKFANFLPSGGQLTEGRADANGHYALTLPYPKDALLKGHGRLVIEIALTLFGPTADTDIRLDGSAAPAPDHGACIGSAYQVACVWPLRQPEWLQNGDDLNATLLPAADLRAPFPFDGSVWQRWLGPQKSGGESNSRLTTREAIGDTLREVSIPF